MSDLRPTTLLWPLVVLFALPTACTTADPGPQVPPSSGGSSGGKGGNAGSGGKGGSAGSGGSANNGGSSGSGGSASNGGSNGGGSTGSGGNAGNTGSGGSSSTTSPDGGSGNDAADSGASACVATPPAGMVNKPYPQHAGFPGCADCIHPATPQATMDTDVGAFYDKWKTQLLKKFPAGDIKDEYFIQADAAGAIKGWPTGVSSVSQSEGHGYGMMTFALMAGRDAMAKTYFDSMNRVRKVFPSNADPRLMSWVIPDNGLKTMPPQGPATDGDMDMAYALLLAHDQWGNEGTNHYLEEARTIIAGLEAKVITTGNGKYFPRFNIGDQEKLSSGPPESKPYLTRPSDFAIGHMRAFKIATGHAVWSDLETGSLNILLAVRHAMTGLVPDFVAGDPPIPSTTGTADEMVCFACFSYNSCRVPWRQAVAVAHYGVAGSRDVAKTMVTWARTKYTDAPAKMQADLNLDGNPTDPANAYEEPTFTSPMVAAGITDTASQKWLSAGWTYMKGSFVTAVADGAYYSNSLTLLSMLTVSGNWWVPSAGACP